jgi:hypothetical protein
VSILVVGTDHIDYLVTAAKAAGIVADGGEDALGRALAGANADAYRDRYLPESGIEDWLVDDDVDDTDEEDDERAWLDAWVAGYRWRPVGNEHLTPARTAGAVACWRYQVENLHDAGTRPGWAEMAALAGTGSHDDAEGDGADRPWVWSRG